VGLMPGAEPFAADGGQVGVVLCHGFTGTPQSLRPWAEHLAAEGFTVALPRLPGHGTRWQDLNVTRWTDWYGELERAFDGLRERCAEVFCGGLSMGGTLCLRLAEERGDQVAGLVLVNPSLGTERRDAVLWPLVARVTASTKPIGSDIKKPGITELAYDRTPTKGVVQLTQAWKATRADLGRVTSPVLVFRSRTDHVVEPLSGRLLRAGCTSCEVSERVLEDSYHVATLDHDAPTIFAGSVEWIRAHSRHLAADDVSGGAGDMAGDRPGGAAGGGASGGATDGATP
jgi:carboxylesterase